MGENFSCRPGQPWRQVGAQPNKCPISGAGGAKSSAKSSFSLTGTKQLDLDDRQVYDVTDLRGLVWKTN